MSRLENEALMGYCKAIGVTSLCHSGGSISVRTGPEELRQKSIVMMFLDCCSRDQFDPSREGYVFTWYALEGEAAPESWPEEVRPEAIASLLGRPVIATLHYGDRPPEASVAWPPKPAPEP